MPFADLPRFFRTARHLRPSQVMWRGRYALERRARNFFSRRNSLAALATGVVPSLRADFPDGLTALCDAVPEQSPEPELIDRLARGTFEHLNLARELGRPPDWLLGHRNQDRLWIVTLHYHRWAYELAKVSSRDADRRDEASTLFVEYLSDWIEGCDLSAPGAAELAWNSYAIATRIGWWIRSARLLGPQWWTERAGFQTRFLSSLWRQTEHLASHIEWDLRGNHLLRDAVGLAWGGRYWQGSQAATWLRTAAAIAGDQVREQILPDGGHFERSPMYHLAAMSDLLDLYLLLDESAVRQEIDAALCRMADWLRWVRHPDGEIALLNDSALEAEYTAAGIFRRLEHAGFHTDASPPRGGRYFADTGLAVWQGAPWTVFFDVGPIGPDEQPGHGHADNLTLECSYEGSRLFVDPGAHSYDPNSRRAYDRSTTAHNTVCVDGADSSEVWAIFRVGRRARPLDVDVRTGRDALEASAAHDGYARSAAGGVIHRRRIRVSDGGPLSIVDRIEGRGRHRLAGGWLLEPGWSASPSPDGWELRRGSQTVQVALEDSDRLRKSIKKAVWHPQFGLELQTARLAWEWEGKLPFELTTIVRPMIAAR